MTSTTGKLQQLVTGQMVLLLVLALFLWLRLDDWPKTYFADELIAIKVVEHMQDTGTFDTNWQHVDWRGDYAAGAYHIDQYNFASYHLVMRGFKAIGDVLAPEVPPLLLYRASSVLFQWLACLLVFRWLQRATGIGPALAGLLFLVVMPQAVIDAHYARAESFVMLLVALGLVLGWQSCRQPRMGLADGLAALVWGVAVACKISLAPMAGLAWCSLCWRRVSWAWLVGWWGVLAVGFALSAPAAVLDPAGFVRGAAALFNQYGTASGNVAGQPWLPSAGKELAYFGRFLALPAILLMLMSFTIRRGPIKPLLQFSGLATVAYLLLFAHQQIFFERNLSHLLPLWAVMFALGVQGLQWRLQRSFKPAVAQGLVCVVLVAVLAERAWLSQGLVGTFFRGSTVVAQQVQAYEQQLLSQHPGRLVDFLPMRDLNRLNTFGDGDVLRLPHYKLPAQQQLSEHLQQQGWQLVGSLPLPYGDLPYNQLQINHAPPAYDYYIRTAAAGQPR